MHETTTLTVATCCVCVCVGGVWGVAQWNDVLYVVCCESSLIHAFCTSLGRAWGRRLPDVHVAGLRDATDMAVCADTGHLYVVDNCSCVWKIRVHDQHVVRYRSMLPLLTARASAAFWLGGSVPPCRLRRRKFGYEMVHSKVYLNKCVVSIAPFSYLSLIHI